MKRLRGACGVLVYFGAKMWVRSALGELNLGILGVAYVLQVREDTGFRPDGLRVRTRSGPMEFNAISWVDRRYRNST